MVDAALKNVGDKIVGTVVSYGVAKHFDRASAWIDVHDRDGQGTFRVWVSNQALKDAVVEAAELVGSSLDRGDALGVRVAGVDTTGSKRQTSYEAQVILRDVLDSTGEASDA